MKATVSVRTFDIIRLRSVNLNIDTGCMGTLNETSRTLTSPGYPHSYPKSMRCIWQIKVDLGYTVELMFNDFQVDPPDYIAVYFCSRKHVTEVINLRFIAFRCMTETAIIRICSFYIMELWSHSQSSRHRTLCLFGFTTCSNLCIIHKAVVGVLRTVKLKALHECTQIWVLSVWAFSATTWTFIKGLKYKLASERVNDNVPIYSALSSLSQICRQQQIIPALNRFRSKI